MSSHDSTTVGEMRWTRGGRSSNLEDQRGASGGGRPGMKLGIGGFLLLAVLN
jgi:hypothetical protein